MIPPKPVVAKEGGMEAAGRGQGFCGKVLLRWKGGKVKWCNPRNKSHQTPNQTTAD